jgi:hypothetical protein
MLVDNCKVPDGGIDFKNRGSMGSGHGWGLGWAVAWNCVAKTYVVQQPPGAVNWMIGCIGENRPTPRPFDSKPNLPLGTMDAHGTPVSPRSLYLEQLAERRWFQVVDKGDRPDNWTDTSGSAMFTYTIAKGIEIGLLDKAEYAGVVERGYKGIIENAKINDKGLVDIYCACDGLGVQASYDRYIKYRKSINAKEAVAGFLWATAIVERPALEKARKD